MVLGILKELSFKRVAIVPSSIKKLQNLGLSVVVEQNAGILSGFSDQLYIDHSITVVNRDEIFEKADIIVSIAPISSDEGKKLRSNTVYISMFAPYQNANMIDQCNTWKASCVSMDMIPRTTLAQSMDVLSSMASLAGYKAVLKACEYYQSMFPMMMTAAGTIPPARVLILGAGVAGLQAIATSKRLGGVVEVFDTRAAAKEEVNSLGATFVEVPGAIDDTSAGGYAVQQSEEYLQKQRTLVQEKALKANIIIATAQVRGKKAPVLITEETVNNLKTGSVIVDLAASTGGNCAFTEDKTTITKSNVTIIGNSDLADELSAIASTLFSSNIVNYLQILIKDKEIRLDTDNEIISASLISKSN